ncbi:unnamed protein product, partial [Nesidiocoris tenuis]
MFTVLDMNDNPPKLEQSVYTWLSEEASRGQVVTIVSASDPDAIDHNRLSYSIVGGNQQQTFSMDKDTGIISLTNLHKLVETRAHILNVSVSDGVYTSFTKVTIEMIAANQHSPEFNKHLYESRILENLPPGAIVAKVAATDKDSDYFGTVTYFIQSSLMNEKFTINNMTGTVVTRVKLVSEMPVKYKLLSGTNQFNIDSSGQITLIGQLDRESESSHVIGVLAHTESSPPLTAVAEISLQVLDYNDNKPYFDSDHYDVYIAENLKEGSLILKDQQPFCLKYRYKESVSEGVPPGTHILNVRAADLDLDSKLRFYLTGNGSETFILDRSSVVFGKTFHRNSTFSVLQEDKRPGWPVVQLLVTDNDIAPNTGPFVFDLLAGKSRPPFRIETDGTIRTAALLSHKRESSYSLHVRVFDNGSPTLYSDTWVIVKVIEESQYPPIVTPLDIWIGSYQERWLGGEIGRIHATDQDQYDIMNYSIVNNPTLNPLFSLEPRQGVLTSSSGLDTGHYSLNVSVSDGKFTSYTTSSRYFSFEFHPNPEEETAQGSEIGPDDRRWSYQCPRYWQWGHRCPPSHQRNIKRISETTNRGPRRTLSCVEDDARILGGYHWDCSDWVRPNQNPLPNITEVPGSEVPDSSSFHSNDSNDDSAVEQRLLPLLRYRLSKKKMFAYFFIYEELSLFDDSTDHRIYHLRIMTSIGVRQQKLEQQRQLLEQKMRQKKQLFGTVHSSDNLTSASLVKARTMQPSSASRERDLHENTATHDLDYEDAESSPVSPHTPSDGFGMSGVIAPETSLSSPFIYNNLNQNSEVRIQVDSSAIQE